jgi:SapC
MIPYLPLRRWTAPVVPIDPPLGELDRLADLVLAEGEIMLTAHYYPLAVRLDGADPTIVAIVRRNMLARSMIGPDGRWLGAYTPISLRCFPLRLASQPTDDPLADLEVANFKPASAQPKLLRIKDEAGAPTSELKAIYDGLKTVWESQQKMRAALDFLLAAELLVPIADPEGGDKPSPYFAIDRRRAGQLSPRALEAMTRTTFGAVDLLTVLTFSQAHLRPDLRSPLATAPATADGAVVADTTLVTGIDTITPWLDTSPLFPGAWAADASNWATQQAPETALPGAAFTAPASTPAAG